MEYKHHEAISIAQYIQNHTKITSDQILQIKQQSQENNISFIRCLLNMHLLDDYCLAIMISQYFNLPYIDLDQIADHEINNQLINENLLRKNNILPLFAKDNCVMIVLDDPLDQDAINALKFQINKPLLIMIAESDKLSSRIDAILKQKEHERLTQYFSINSSTVTNNLEHDQAPVTLWINRIINQAIEKNASDIHFEPYENFYRIRYRQDGILYEIDSPPSYLAHRLVSKIKIMSNLDISEKRLPQDGRFNLETMDCRVSTCPTIFGEKLVIRLLNNKRQNIDLEQLFTNNSQKNIFIESIHRPQGIILITGPTGSGKTLTLYAALNHLNNTTKNICTAEDPVEIKLNGVNQVAINPNIGLGFAEILRTFLRQDPDIIMLGEIRDLETADIALKASQTGHLVLSSVHTNSAAQTLVRLINLGINPSNLASSINLIVAQRLVRRLCNECKQESNKIYNAIGCSKCNNGYYGRCAIFELMPISITLQQMIINNYSIIDICHQAKKEGMLSLYESGMQQVHAGITTIEEIMRVTQECSI